MPERGYAGKWTRGMARAGKVFQICMLPCRSSFSSLGKRESVFTKLMGGKIIPLTPVMLGQGLKSWKACSRRTALFSHRSC